MTKSPAVRYNQNAAYTTDELVKKSSTAPVTPM